MRQFRAIKPINIGRGVIPVNRELYPGDFGLSEARLVEMADREQVEEIKAARKRSAPDYAAPSEDDGE